MDTWYITIGGQEIETRPDGTITAKMGKKTASDLLAELEAAYDRG